jgi:cell division protein FtsN
LPVKAPPVSQAPTVATPVAAALPPATPHPLAKPAKPVTIASLADAAIAQKPAVKTPPSPPPIGPPTISPPPPPLATAAAPPPGAAWVQIGAFSSSALADKGWGDIVMLAPAAMAGKGKKVEALSKEGKTLYRAYITGFSGRDSAQAFCDKLKAAGKACFVK